MHRIIAVMIYGDAAISGSVQVDHVNGDRSDNRVCNLRVASHSQNGMNREASGSNTGYRGISFLKKDRKYHATIYVGGKRVWTKSFKDLKDAVISREDALPLYHGDFAYINRRLLNDARSGVMPETPRGASPAPDTSSPDGRVAP